jgi:hypothetical protein
MQIGDYVILNRNSCYYLQNKQIVFKLLGYDTLSMNGTKIKFASIFSPISDLKCTQRASIDLTVPEVGDEMKFEKTLCSMKAGRVCTIHELHKEFGYIFKVDGGTFMVPVSYSDRLILLRKGNKNQIDNLNFLDSIADEL